MDLLIFSVILFIVCIAASIIGVFLLFLMQNKRMQNVVFFVLACWALYISYLNASTLPIDHIGQQLLGWLFGFVAAVALLLRYAGKTEARYPISNVMVALSTVFSVLCLFLLAR